MIKYQIGVGERLEFQNSNLSGCTQDVSTSKYKEPIFIASNLRHLSNHPFIHPIIHPSNIN